MIMGLTIIFSVYLRGVLLHCGYCVRTCGSADPHRGVREAERMSDMVLDAAALE